MAIDVLNRIGKSAVVGLLGKNLRRISGNIGSVIRGDIGADSSSSSPINRTKQSTKMLSFPLDVGADPGIGNHGHYIMFFINEQNNAKLKFGGGNAAVAGAQDMGLENIVGEARKRKLKGLSKGFDTKAQSFLDMINPDKIGSQLIAGLTDSIGGFGLASKGRIKTEKKHQIRSQKDQTVAFQRSKTTRLDTAISMYMPPIVKTSYKSNYDDIKIGAFSAGAIKAVNLIKDEKMGVTDPAVKEALSGAITDGSAAIARGFAKELGGGVIEQMEMAKGEIISDRLELVFKGIEKRSFSYDFKMMPRSKAEADEIAEIIFAFKFHMLPELAGSGDGRNLKVPSTFDIQYMYVNQENKYLHKISTCYLESMDITYGGSKYTTYDGNADGAPPVETNISLSFKEIELITRERVEEGF